MNTAFGWPFCCFFGVVGVFLAYLLFFWPTLCFLAYLVFCFACMFSLAYLLLGLVYLAYLLLLGLLFGVFGF